ncbi:PLDc N-terminal domain-containing protein [Beggiatoa alba]|uniref:PLDc N-terminal domain-containing protein n=1 Tax=Beggiatoa alba TaxID=1022 RepID=UPI00030BBF53|nr:PLDc N-terminal domain-containing protein [Beggiatoa alba]
MSSDFNLLSVLIPFLALVLVFITIVSALVDCLRHEFTGFNKIIWILVIILLPIFGGMLYFFIGSRIHKIDASGGRSSGSSAVTGSIGYVLFFITLIYSYLVISGKDKELQIVKSNLVSIENTLSQSQEYTRQFSAENLRLKQELNQLKSTSNTSVPRSQSTSRTSQPKPKPIQTQTREIQTSEADGLLQCTKNGRIYYYLEGGTNPCN